MKWPQVAKRVTYLIENDKFLKAADYSRMPGYEREQMVNRILSFYARLPKETERPFTDDFFHDDARIELAAALEDTETAAELVEKMDAALASLPLDFEGYEAKVQFLVDLHGYVEGTYTIFPERVQETAVENGKQLSLFDWMESDIQDKEEKKEPLEKEAGESCTGDSRRDRKSRGNPISGADKTAKGGSSGTCGHSTGNHQTGTD